MAKEEKETKQKVEEIKEEPKVKRVPYTAPYISGVCEEPIFLNFERTEYLIKRGEEVMLPEDLVEYLNFKEQYRKKIDEKVNRQKQN